LASISDMLLSWQKGKLDSSALSDSDGDGEGDDGVADTLGYITEEDYQR
jgi:hypothetical protein